MKELVITETIYFKEYPNEKYEVYSFPNIQKHLNEGYTIKNIFYSPIELKSIVGIAITAHFQKSE